MDDDREARELVRERPDLEAALRSILAIDENADTWTFDDVPVETGPFGELVGRDVVESVDDAYRLRNPEAVRAALANDANSSADTRSDVADTSGDVADTTGAVKSTNQGERYSPFSDRSLPRNDAGRRVALTVAIGLLFVAARLIPYGNVFRDGDVVLTGNDPYFYRYWVDQVLAQSRNPLALDVLPEIPLPESTAGEPLFVATVWWFSALLGGSQETAGAVLAWYPVVAAVAIGAVTYLVGARLLGDVRIGLLAAFLLAISPAHAMRTSLGFGDHHAFDYLWLMATIAVLAWLVTASDDDPYGPWNRRGALALGVAVTGLVMAWEGSPLVLFPIAGYLAVRVPLDVRAGQSPLRSNASVLVGLAVASVLTLGVYLVLGWQSLAVVAVPGLLAAGGVGLAAVCGVLGRRGVSARQLVAAELAVPVAGVLGLSLLVDDAAENLLEGVGFLLGAGGIAETDSAFGPAVLGGIELFGIVLVLALPVMAWATVRGYAGDRHWLVLSCFGWYFLALSALQLRFVGQLAPLAALFASVGVLWWVARLGLTDPPAPFAGPERDDAGEQSPSGPSSAEPTSSRPSPTPTTWFDTSGLSLRSGALAFVLVVALVGTSGWYLPGKVSGGAIADRNYETANWMAEYAAGEGWTFPESYVFSEWGGNRFFNYVVSGESRSYEYAERNYSAFITSTDTERWYERLRDRVGFVVIEPLPPRPNTNQRHFYETYGSHWRNYGAVSHYRAVYTTELQTNKVFVLVPGARVVGDAPANATVELRTTVDIPNDSFLYRQRPSVDGSGRYEAVVPYPGEYEVRVNNRTTTVAVPERAVENGSRVPVGG